MPLDTTEFDKRIAASMFSGTSGKDTYRGQGEAVMQLALEVVKTNFPDLVAKTHTKIVAAEPKSPGAYGEYTFAPFVGTDEIRLKRADRWSPAWSAREQGPGSAIPSSSSVNFTTQEVLDSVNTVLHEIYHGQSKGGMFRQGVKEAANLLSPEDLKKINELAVNKTNNFAASLFSMKDSHLDVEEFLANAFALTNMRDRKMIMPGSRSEEQLKTLDEIIAKVPNAKKFIDLQMQPNTPSLSAPPTGTLGAMLAKVDAFLNDYSVKETANGAKPGTPRKKD